MKHLLSLMGIVFALLIAVANTSIAQDIDTPETQEVTLHVLVDFVENFERGEDAGGDLLSFGQEDDTANDPNREAILGTFEIQAGEGRSGDSAVFLSTSVNGFGVDSGENFIGFSKNVSSIIIEDGINPPTPATITANLYSAFSYFLKPVSDFSGTTIEVVAELVIGDGGDITPQDTTDNFTGSTWTQANPVVLSSLTPDAGTNNGFVRSVVDLVGNVAGIDGGFERSVGPSVGTNDEELTSALLAQVAAVNIVMRTRVNAATDPGNADFSTVAEIRVDDINFFDNPKIDVIHVSNIFGKSATVDPTVDGDGALFEFKAILSGYDPTLTTPPLLELTKIGAGFLNGDADDTVNSVDLQPVEVQASPPVAEVNFIYRAKDVSEIAEFTVNLK